MRGSATTCVLFLLVTICTATQRAQAANLNVNCDKKETIRKALRLLAATNPQGPNTIFVSGTCKENIVVQSLDRLSLLTKSGASIRDRSKGTLAVLDIEDAHSVTVQGFMILGGDTGVFCSNASVCYLTANTIQSAVGQQGVGVSNGSRAFLTGNMIQNNTQRGLTVNEGSQVFSSGDTFQNNVDAAMVANSGAYLSAVSTIVQSNGSDGASGVVATDRSTMRLISCTITGSGGDGVTVFRSSEARFDNYLGPTTITGNGGAGVSVADLSFALFGPSTITGNTGGDVVCAPQFSATRGALTNIGGGTTNCVEPTNAVSSRKTAE
jgi:Right handed beta helix region